MNYTSNYIKNYIFQILATGIGLLSLFVVIPFISGDKTLYGIYSICVSLTIFVNYADLGFLTAGQKFAAESFAKRDFDEEKRYVGFTLYVLFLFLTFVLLCFVPIAFRPNLLISCLDENSANVASSLIWIIILFSPVMALKRVIHIAYAIRIEHYKCQVVTFLANVIKILSVFYFFKYQSYNIVGYYLFIHIIELFSVLILLCYAERKYGYVIKSFFRTVRYSACIFNKVKSLAGASLLNSISWILFYELDLIVLAKIASPEIVAIYSIAFQTLTLFRSYLAILYSAFAPRYNHYVGENNMCGLRVFYKNNIVILAPFVLYPIIVYCFSCHSFLLSWVGENYIESIPLSVILVLGNLCAFFNYPSSALLTSLDKVKAIIIASLCLPLIFYGGVLCTFFLIGITSFAVFKSIAMILSSIYCFVISIRSLDISLIDIIKRILANYFFSVVVCCILTYFATSYMINIHSSKGLLMNILMMVIIIVFVFLLTVVLSPDFNRQTKSVVELILKRK